MGESWIERTAIALLLMLVATLGSRQWFRIELAAASVTQRAESAAMPAERQTLAKRSGLDIPMEGEARVRALAHLREVIERKPPI